MSITICEPPPKRTSGRRPRLSDEDINDLKEGFLADNWVTDNEPVDTKSAAYQRAQSARDLVLEVLGDEYKVDHIKTAVEPVDINDLTKGYIWKIGPRPNGEKPRRAPRGRSKPPKGATPKSGSSK